MVSEVLCPGSPIRHNLEQVMAGSYAWSEMRVLTLIKHSAAAFLFFKLFAEMQLMKIKTHIYNIINGYKQTWHLIFVAGLLVQQTV